MTLPRRFPRRYRNIFSHSGIQQGTEVHNVLRFEDGGQVVTQQNASTTLAWQQSVAAVQLQADLSPFYASSGAVTSWQRQIAFDAGKLEVHDVYAVEPGVEAFFQIHTPIEPVVAGNVILAGELIVRPLVPASPSIESSPGRPSTLWNLAVGTASAWAAAAANTASASKLWPFSSPTASKAATPRPGPSLSPGRGPEE